MSMISTLNGWAAGKTLGGMGCEWRRPGAEILGRARSAHGTQLALLGGGRGLNGATRDDRFAR